MRKRMIDPEFWLDEKLATLSPHARLLFIGLWGMCDDNYATLPNRPEWIKAQVFPYESVNARQLLDELSNNNFIVLFKKNSEEFWHIRNFFKYQKIDKPSQPKYAKFEDNKRVLTEPSPSPRSEVNISKDKIREDKIREDKINKIGKASPKFKKLEEDKKQLAQKLSLREGLTQIWQEKALRYANYLQLDLKNPSYRARWFDFFKRNQNSAVDLTISSIKDAPTFLTLINPEEKIKYFFGVYYGKLKPS